MGVQMNKTTKQANAPAKRTPEQIQAEIAAFDAERKACLEALRDKGVDYKSERIVELRGIIDALVARVAELETALRDIADSGGMHKRDGNWAADFARAALSKGRI